MTTHHDKLLALLNERDIGCGKNCQSAYGALRAVVELHKPDPTRDCCLEGANYVHHPCPTIQAIEKELG